MNRTLWSLLSVLVLLGSLSLASGQAEAQVLCSQLGNFTYCDTPSGSHIQADLGYGHGVIIGPRETTSYTILQSSPAAQQHSHRATPPTPLFIPMPQEEPAALDQNYSSTSTSSVYGYQAPLPYPGGMGE